MCDLVTMKTDGSSVVEPERRRKASKRKSVSAAGGNPGAGRRRTKQRIHAASTAIQRLFLSCRAVFKGKGTVPTPPDVRKLQLLLDKMRPEDLGLSRDLLKASSVAKGNTRIAYTTIYNCDNFSICLFFLPAEAVIPLHNHPGMTVFSKLLLGSMHIKSYDWVDPVKKDEPAPSSKCKVRPAKLVVDSDFTAPCDTAILFPSSGGNMHTFTAITPCVVLDVLGPPYSKKEDRDCTYYKDHPYSDFPDDSIVTSEWREEPISWLEEIEIPKDLKMDRVDYLGPQIIDH